MVHARLPLGHALLPVGLLVLKFSFQPGHTLMHLPEPHLFRRRIDHAPGFVVIVQEGEHSIVFLLRDRVVLVIVALRAANRQAENAFADGVHPVEHRLHPELFGVRAAFLIDHRVAQKSGRHDLILGGVRQLIAGELLDNELIVGQIPVKRVDDPVAVEPDVAHGILLVAVAVRIAGRIQPLAAPALAVVRAGKEFVDPAQINGGRRA